MSSPDYSAPSPVDGYYDVFLSFRGYDTRRSFTTNLYHTLKQNHIHTFMDEHNLTGEDIDHIFEVIAKSRMAVVIYSENFASSDWCLRELETILQHREDKKILVTPIFYKVNLTELKHVTGKTATYLDQHVAAHGKSSADLWKVAVKKLGRISGFSYNDIEYRSEYVFRMDVTAIIKKKLSTQQRSTDQSSQVNNQSTSSHGPLATEQASSSQRCQVESNHEDRSLQGNEITEREIGGENPRATAFYDDDDQPNVHAADHNRSTSSHGFFSAEESEVSRRSTNEVTNHNNYPNLQSGAATTTSNDGVMTIYVIALFRLDRILLKVHPATTIGDIKAELRKVLRLKVTEDKQHLYFNGDMDLNDNTRTLASYNIPDEATLCTFK